MSGLSLREEEDKVGNEELKTIISEHSIICFRHSFFFFFFFPFNGSHIDHTKFGHIYIIFSIINWEQFSSFVYALIHFPVLCA